MHTQDPTRTHCRHCTYRFIVADVPKPATVATGALLDFAEPDMAQLYPIDRPRKNRLDNLKKKDRKKVDRSGAGHPLLESWRAKSREAQNGVANRSGTDKQVEAEGQDQDKAHGRGLQRKLPASQKKTSIRAGRGATDRLSQGILDLTVKLYLAEQTLRGATGPGRRATALKNVKLYSKCPQSL
jgi:hypothetical protein